MALFDRRYWEPPTVLGICVGYFAAVKGLSFPDRFKRGMLQGYGPGKRGPGVEVDEVYPGAI